MRVVDGHERAAPDARATPASGSASDAASARWRAGIRLALAVGIAALCCWLAWRRVPDVLAVRTSIVGYPTFHDFDYTRYFAAFSLLAVLLPTLVFAADHVLGARGPLRRPAPRGPLFPLRARSERTEEVAAGTLGAIAAACGRVLLPALVVALEVSAASSSAARTLDASGVLAGVAYVVAVAGGGFLVAALRARAGAGRAPSAWWARANAVASPVVLLLLWLVSRATNVTVTAGPRVVAYPWFPWWLAALAALAAEAYVLARLRRADGRAARRTEGQLLAVVVGTVLVFLLVSGIPSAQGPFDSFDPQELAGAQLVFVHGLLPWRDVFLLHGLLEDALSGWLGMTVFSHTAWGAFAGIDLFVYPASACVFYLFVVYFARGNRLVALLGGALIVGGFTTAIMRFAFLPLVVVLFDRMLRRRSAASAAAFSAVLVLECALVPEILLMAAALGVTLIARELTSTPRGEPGRYRLIGVCAATGAAASAVFGVYLVLSGSASGFVEYFRLFTSDHALWGALPTAWSLSAQPRITAYFWLPVVLVLATVARTVALARLRRPFTSRDWTMLACAVFVLVYFQKGLDRTDVSHVIEVYTVATPLVLLSGITALEWCERTGRAFAGALVARRRVPRADVEERRRRVALPAALAALVVVFATVPSIFTKVRDAPGATHASAPVAASVPRLGYEIPGDFPTAEVSTLGRLLDVYAGVRGPVFDFANEPVVTYFLLNRTPGTAFFHAEMAETRPAQQLLVDQLRRSRPRVVLFTAQDLGLGLAYDGIPGMVRQWLVSSYVLAHYRPIANAYGQVVMLRADLVGHVPSVASLHLAGVSTANLYFAGQSCLWGDTPNFFPAPVTVPGSTRRVAVSGGAAVNYQLTGWAVDAHVLTPAKEVFAVSDGRVIGTAHPSLFRLDIEDYFHSAAVLYAGWSMDVEIPPGQRAQVYSLNRDGTVSRLQPNPAPGWLASSPATTSVVGPDGVRHPIARGHWLPGWTNYATKVAARVYTLQLPASLRPGAYQWLTFHSARSLGGARYVFGDLPAEGGHQISFTALRSAGRTMSVRVGSCLDWHGFGHRLELVVDRAGTGRPAALAVTLARAAAGS